MLYTLIATLVGALALFLLGRRSTDGKVRDAQNDAKTAEAKAHVEEARANIAQAASAIARDSLADGKSRAEAVEEVRTRLEEANNRGSYDGVLKAANDLLSIAKEVINK